jgi:tRNA modification GTPase
MIDDVLLAVFRRPHSYTGEDMIEVSCHGGTAAPQAALRALLAAGARPAGPGEFTRRAVLNGKLDLTQAEAVQELVQASGELGRTRALRQLAGRLAHRVEQLGAELDDVQSRLAAQVEFGDELPARVAGPVQRRLALAHRELRRLLGQAASGSLLRTGALVVIVGRPNVGKSSLFNRLAGEERAIVTEIPGTTRDCLEADINLAGLAAKLVDTAGWRTHAGRIEALGRVRARHYVERADALLVVLDGSQELQAEDRAVLAATAHQRRLLVLNKADLAGPDASHRFGRRESAVPVSARTGHGISALVAWLRRQFVPRASEADFVASPRHVEALHRADAALAAARRSRAGDLRLHEVGRARQALAELLGQRTSEAVLDQVFSTFCIGK